MKHKLKVLISISNQLDTIPLFQAELEQLLRQKQVSEETIQRLSLISEEILSNTICHGYVDTCGNPGPQRKSNIEVTVAVEYDHSVFLQFCDEATPFDPLSPGVLLADPNPDQGWGLTLIKSLPDRASYVRRYGYNIIELRVEDIGRKGDGPSSPFSI